MAEELTPEIRQRLEALRESARRGELTPAQIQDASAIIRRLEGSEATSLAPQRGPTSVEEITGGFVNRPAMEAVGGITGSLLAGGTALPTGPGALAAAAAGGALGAGAGSAAFDNTNDFLRALGVLETPPDATQGFERAGEIAVNAARAGVSDAAFAMGGVTALTGAQMAAKPLLGKILGLRTPEAQRIINMAEAQGIGVGASTVAPGVRGRVIRGLSTIIGVFPWMGTVRGGIADQLKNVNTRLLTLLDNYGPTSILQSQLGINMIEAAKGARREFVQVSSELYNHARSLSAALGDPKIIPSFDIKRVGQEFAERQAAGALLNEAGEPLERATADKLGDFLTGLSTMEDSISFAQFDSLSNQLRDLVGSLSKEGFDVSRVAQIRSAMEEAARSLDIRNPAIAEIAEAFGAADEFFSKHIAEFQTPTAQRFGRVDRNIMRAGFEVPGSISADEAADIVLNLRSPQAVRDLRTLVGNDIMDQSARGYLESAFEASIRDGVPDAQLLKNNLGLGGPRRVSDEALKEFIGPDTFENLVKITDVLDEIPALPNASKFILRRTVLGGARSFFTGAFLFGGGGSILGSAGATKVLAFAYLARRAGALLNDPAQLQAMTRMLTDTTMTNVQRRMLLGRIMEANGDVLSIGVSGPPEVQGLTIQEALNNSAAMLSVDFVPAETNAEAMARAEESQREAGRILRGERVSESL